VPLPEVVEWAHQRGGDVQSNLRLSDKEIASDLIPFGKADMILSVEPMESLRYLPWLAPNGWLITNSTTFANIPNYPKKEDIMDEIKKQRNHIIIDADFIAKEIGSARSANMVVLGAATPFLGIEYKYFEQAIRNLFGSKGEKVVQLNLEALIAGEEFARKHI